MAVVDTVSPGKVAARITTSSNTIQLAISQNFAMLFQSLSFTIGLYVVSFVKSWLLTLVASASLPFIVIVYGLTLPIYMRIHKKTTTIIMQASAIAYETFSSIRIVVAFGAEGKLAKQHQDVLLQATKNGKKNAPWMGLMVAPSFLAMYGTFGLTFWFAIKQYQRGHINSLGPIVT